MSVIRPVRRAVHARHLRTESGRVRLLRSIRPGLPPILNGCSLLLRIFAGLINGTLGFARPNNRIVLQTRHLPYGRRSNAPNSYVQIRVSSANVNVTPRSRRTVFSHFFQMRGQIRALRKAKLKLSVIGGVVRGRGDRIRLIDRININAAF